MIFVYIYLNQSVLSMLWAIYLNIIHTFSGYIIIIPVTHILYIHTIVWLLLLYIYTTVIYIYIYIKHVPSHIPYNCHFSMHIPHRSPWKVHIEAFRVSRSCQRWKHTWKLGDRGNSVGWVPGGADVIGVSWDFSSKSTRPGYDIHSSPWFFDGPNRNRWFSQRTKPPFMYFGFSMAKC